jgi:hypothetical protein
MNSKFQIGTPVICPAVAPVSVWRTQNLRGNVDAVPLLLPFRDTSEQMAFSFLRTYVRNLWGLWIVGYLQALYCGAAIGAFGTILVANDPGWRLVVPFAVLGMALDLVYWRFVTMADRGTG